MLGSYLWVFTVSYKYVATPPPPSPTPSHPRHPESFVKVFPAVYQHPNILLVGERYCVRVLQ